MKKAKILAFLASVAIIAQSLPVDAVTTSSAPVGGAGKNIYQSRFEDLYDDIKNPNNGYFSPQGVPYHSVETLICEAPDHGHESTSETASYYVWLEAMKGKFSGNFNGVSEAWDIIEKYYIPTDDDQPGQTDYKPSKPATYAAEYSLPSFYPSRIDFGAPVGSDPIANELKAAFAHALKRMEEERYGLEKAEETVEGSMNALKAVITSYSIHYTKLYEIQISKTALVAQHCTLRNAMNFMTSLKHY